MIQAMTPRGGKRAGAGRHAKDKDNPRNRKVSSMISPSEKSALDAVAERQGINISSIIRKFILDGLKRLRRKK